jgi:tetratricopeptide (TPR) repeat protein
MSIEKHWASRQPAKQDEVRDLFAKGLDFALTRKREVAAGLGGAVLLAAAISVFVYSRAARENEAWDKLSMAEAYSYYGRAQEASATLTAVVESNASPAAVGLAGLMEAELKQAQGEHDAALASFSRAADAAPDQLKPFAVASRVSALETAGKPAECVASAQAFLESQADHFLGPQVQETLARCQLAAGSADAARATWQKISLQYPDTPWAARANARLQAGTK